MKYRKKPIVIEAMQWDGSTESYVRIVEELNSTRIGDGRLMLCDDPEEGGTHISLSTLNGNVTVLPSEWIIKGVRGEFYPCKPDIFEKTYEKVE